MSEGTADVEVAPVSGHGDLHAFLRLPWRIYRGDPRWVPPLLSEVKKVLDRSRHPFHAHAEVEFYLARRHGEVVGRVAAIVNHRFNDFHGVRIGTFGFFECTEDVDAARALLRRAALWSQERGMTLLQGPFNLSTNDELFSPGVLLEGFEDPPVLMMGHTPRYYSRLLEACGFAKSKDLLSYRVEADAAPDRLLRGMSRIKGRQRVVLRSLNLRDLDGDIRRIEEIYHSAWERNWGFVPMTDAEFEYMARSLEPVIDPRFCAIAEIDEDPVGFALQLPDLNQAFKRMDGRLLPLGWLKFLWHRRRIDTARVLALGVKPEHRRRGIDTMLILHLFQEGLRAGYSRAECAWILEDNLPMRRGLERIGGRVHKVYRVFEKPIPPPG
ncbi:MAG: N-acetyltransferase family protein [Longimicrobiales bacterium]